MEQGADYFLTRPLSPIIFKAVLVALLRRMLVAGESDRVDVLAWIFNRRKRILVSPSGEEVKFSERETAILTTLFMSPHMAVSTDRLMQSLNMHVELFDPHRIDTIIYRIRRKLSEIRHSKLQIKNLYGQGYICIGEEGNARFYVLDGQ